MSEPQAPRPMDGYYSPWRASMGQSGSIYATVDGGEAFVNEVTREGEAPILKDAVFVAKVTKWLRKGPSTGTILNAHPQIASDPEVAAAVKRAVVSVEPWSIPFPIARERAAVADAHEPADRRIFGERFPVESPMLMDDPIDPADRRIIAWMPTEYMEAARAGQGKPDALDVARDFTGLKVGDVVQVDPRMLLPPPTEEEERYIRELFGLDAPEAAPVAPCDPWLISPASLPAALRNGPENGKGKARARMVYDFEEVP